MPIAGTAAAVVVCGGEPPHPDVVAQLPAVPATVIAADAGLDHAMALGLRVDLVVGDLDSVTPASLIAAEARGITVERHPQDKDDTDLELALRRAVELGATEVIVLGGDGGRFDHTLAAASSLTHPALREVVVTAWMGRAWLAPVHPGRPRSFRGDAGALVSLLAVGGPATGVRTMGLRWPLHDETLQPGSSRGVSNEMAGGDAQVSLSGGCLLAIRPYALP